MLIPSWQTLPTDLQLCLHYPIKFISYVVYGLEFKKSQTQIKPAGTLPPTPIFTDIDWALSRSGIAREYPLPHH